MIHIYVYSACFNVDLLCVILKFHWALMYIGGAVISVTQHNDKKPLEAYDKDSERVHHHWLPVEFINEK